MACAYKYFSESFVLFLIRLGVVKKTVTVKKSTYPLLFNEKLKVKLILTLAREFLQRAVEQQLLVYPSVYDIMVIS